MEFVAVSSKEIKIYLSGNICSRQIISWVWLSVSSFFCFSNNITKAPCSFKIVENITQCSTAIETVNIVSASILVLYLLNIKKHCASGLLFALLLFSCNQNILLLMKRCAKAFETKTYIHEQKEHLLLQVIPLTYLVTSLKIQFVKVKLGLCS